LVEIVKRGSGIIPVEEVLAEADPNLTGEPKSVEEPESAE
jgi:hypothetical protein